MRKIEFSTIPSGLRVEMLATLFSGASLHEACAGVDRAPPPRPPNHVRRSKFEKVCELFSVVNTVLIFAARTVLSVSGGFFVPDFL